MQYIHGYPSIRHEDEVISALRDLYENDVGMVVIVHRCYGVAEPCA
jgi:hypothetical protein